jgi:hypothetical protein
MWTSWLHPVTLKPINAVARNLNMAATRSAPKLAPHATKKMIERTHRKFANRRLQATR